MIKELIKRYKYWKYKRFYRRAVKKHKKHLIYLELQLDQLKLT